MQIQKKKVNTKGVFSYYQDKNQGSPNKIYSGTKNKNPLHNVQLNEDNYGEMQYTDPNDFRRAQDMSPVYEGNESQSNIFSQRGQRKRTRPNDSNRKDRLIRSPIRINVGEPEKEYSYNINRGNSPWERDHGNQMYLQTSPVIHGENATNYLDPPLNTNNFHNDRHDVIVNKNQSPIVGIDPFQMKGEYIDDGGRDIQNSMNPRDLKEQNIDKFSPNKNIDDDMSENKGSEDNAHFKDLKFQGDSSAGALSDEDGGMMEHPRQILNDIDKINDYVKNRESRETMTKKEFKKLMKEIAKDPDKTANESGRLIGPYQTISPEQSSNLFQGRYKVLQKMNKLSNILLSKDRRSEDKNDQSYNIRGVDDTNRKTFNKNTLDHSLPGGRKQNFGRSPQNKFLYLSLALISSKGPNCEDRIILRKMRIDKGGVVDLAQDAQKKKSKVQIIKKANKGRRPSVKAQFINPKHREKAAKVIQGWWRDIKDRYQKILDKIILLQSVWRGRWIRQYIYDILYISMLSQRFCDTIGTIMTNHVRPIVWDELFGGKKRAKEYLKQLLDTNDKRYSLLRSKGVNDKWNKKAQRLKQREKHMKDIVKRKEMGENLYKLLQKCFKEWNLKASLIKYIGECKDHVDKKKKFFGSLNIINASNLIGKQSGLQKVAPKLKEYLDNKIRNGLMKTLFRKLPHYQRIILRRAFQKWLNQLQKLNVKDIKNKMFKHISTRLDSRMNRAQVKTHFNLWRSKLPKNKFLDYMNGADKLRAATLRKTLKDPYNALKEKAEYLNEKESILRLLGVKQRYIKHHWREYLYKWRNRAQKLKDKIIQNKLYASLLNTTLSKLRFRLLSNAFNHWHNNKPLFDIDSLFHKYKTFCHAMQTYTNKKTLPLKQQFMHKFKSSIHPKTFKKACEQLIEQYLNKDKNILRYFYYKWRLQSKDIQIYNLQLQILKSIAGSNNSRTRRNILSKALGRWKHKINQINRLEHEIKLRKVNNGLHLIEKLLHNRYIDFITRLYRKMNKDYRPNFIKNIVNKLFKPRGTVRDCFIKWKRVNDIEKADDTTKQLKYKLLQSKAKRLNARQIRDILHKSFYKWLKHTHKHENYFPSIVKGTNVLKSYVINKHCKEPFNKLMSCKNYAKMLIPLLKSNKHLQKRMNKDSLRNKFNRWKDIIKRQDIHNLKSNLLFKMKNNILLTKRKQFLSKYFTRWKVYRPKGLNIDCYKGLMLMKKNCQRKFIKDMINAFKVKIENVLKNEGLFTLFGTSKTFKKRILKNAIMKWWKLSILLDPKKFERIKTRLRRLVRDKAELPLEKAFHKWVRRLTKIPNFQNLLNASDSLKKALILHNKPQFNKLKNHISNEYVRKKIFKNILPNSNLSKSRILKNALHKWHTKIKDIGIKNLKTNLFAKLYSSTKGTIQQRFLRNYFRRWAHKGPEKKALDLLNVLKGMDIIHKTLANKYLKGFYGNMDELGREKFLRSILLGTSKYHKRKMKPFFDKWRSKANKLSAKALLYNISSHFMHTTNKYRTAYKLQNILRGRFNKWKQIIKDIQHKEKVNIPKGIEAIKKRNTKLNGNDVINKLKTAGKNKRKEKLLKSLPSKKEKCLKNILHHYLMKWKYQLMVIRLLNMNKQMKFNKLKHLIYLLEKGPLKYFIIWKTKAGFKRSPSTLIYGMLALRKGFIKPHWKTFAKRADMINLIIPRGMSTQTALVRKKRNLAKSISLRNCSVRPMWNRWKNKATALKYKAHRHKVFDKIITPSIKSIEKIALRKEFNTWKNNTISLNAKDKLKQLQLKLMHLLCGKNLLTFIRKYFNKWKTNIELLNQKTLSYKTAANKLRLYSNRNVVNKLRQLLLKQSKFNRVKALLINRYRLSDNNILSQMFFRWNDIVNKLKRLQLKTIILKNLSIKQDFKNSENVKHKLHHSLLLWRIKCAPKHYLDDVRNIREGNKLFKKGLRSLHLKEVFNGIQNRSNERYRRYLQNKIINGIGPKSDLLNKRRAFSTWLSKLGDTNKLKRKLQNMFNKYLTSEPVFNDLVLNPIRDLIDNMNAFDKLKHDNAKTISDYIIGLLNIKKQIAKMKRNKILHKAIHSLTTHNKHKLMNYFRKWIHNSNLLKLSDEATRIQDFIRSRLNNPSNKRKRYLRGLDFLQTHIKKIVFTKILKASQDNYKNNTLLKRVNVKKANDDKFLKDIFMYWKELMPILHQHKCASIIQNNYLIYKSKQKLNNLRNRNSKIEYLILKLIQKYFNKTNTILKKWNALVKYLSCVDKSTLIQTYLKDKLNSKLKSKAQDKLYKLFYNDVIFQLCLHMKKASKIIGDKGEVMYRTLENIYIRDPFTKIISALKWISRIKALRNVSPKVIEAIKKHFIPNAFWNWYDKTWTDKVNKVTLLQNKIRNHQALQKVKKAKRLNDVLSKQIKKLAKENELKLLIPFKTWYRKTIMSKLNDNVNAIQNSFRQFLANRKVNRLLSCKRLNDMFKSSLFKNISTLLTKTYKQFVLPLKDTLNDFEGDYEKRYVTNNIVDFANDKLRNTYLRLISGKKSYSDLLSALKRYFIKWRQFNKHSQDSATKIQSVFRGGLARDKRRLLEKLRDRLYDFYLRRGSDDNLKLNSAFRQWLTIAKRITCKENTNIICDFLGPRLAKLLNEKFKNYFIENALKLTKRKLNQLAKVKTFLDAILKPNINYFLKTLRNKTLYDKFRTLFAKRFKHLDDSLLNLLMKNYFKRWKTQTNKLNTLRNQSADKIINAYLTYKAKQKLTNLRNKKNRLLKMLLHAMNDRDLQKQVAFNLWRSKANIMKLTDSSRIIGLFMEEIKRKLNERKQQKRQRLLNKLANALINISYVKEEPFTKIKSESNRNKFSSFNDLCLNKRKTNLQTALDKIKEEEKRFLLNRLFNIPQSLKDKILKKAINNYKDKAMATAKKHSAEMIQRNYKLYSNRKLHNRIHALISERLRKIANKNGNMFDLLFKKWQKNTQHTKIMNAGNKINTFITTKYKRAKARQQWDKLSERLCILNGNYQLLNLLKRTRQFLSIDKLSKAIETQVKRNTLNELKELSRISKIITFLKLIFGNFNKRKEILSLKHYLLKWNNIKNIMNDKDNAIENIIDIIDTRQKIISAEVINNACIVKKLFKTIPKIRALYFFDKLRMNLDAKLQYEDFADSILNAKDELDDQNRDDLVRKIYRLFIYKKLYKAIRMLNNHLKFKVKPLAQKQFLDKLYTNLKQTAFFNCEGQKSSSFRPPITNLSYKKQFRNPKTVPLASSKQKTKILKLIPYLVNFLNNKFIKNKQLVMEKLKDQISYHLFCRKYSSFAKKCLLPLKTELISDLKLRSNYMDTQGIYLINLFKLLRKKWIRYVGEQMVEPSKIYKMFYLVRLTIMHKSIAKQRFIRELVRRWRFYAFKIKVVKRNKQIMDQNFYLSYLQMTDTLFGNEGVPSQFEDLFERMGVLSNENQMLTQSGILMKEYGDYQMLFSSNNSGMFNSGKLKGSNNIKKSIHQK